MCLSSCCCLSTACPHTSLKHKALPRFHWTIRSNNNGTLQVTHHLMQQSCRVHSLPSASIKALKSGVDRRKGRPFLKLPA